MNFAYLRSRRQILQYLKYFSLILILSSPVTKTMARNANHCALSVTSLATSRRSNQMNALEQSLKKSQIFRSAFRPVKKAYQHYSAKQPAPMLGVVHVS